jgi:hypothetical protein
MIVRIDNSQNGVHQIVKRKRNKESNMVVSTSGNIMDDEQDLTPGFRSESHTDIHANKLSESLDVNALADTATKFVG